MPKFALLVTFSAAIAPTLALALLDRSRGASLLRSIKSKHVALVSLYFIIVLVSTVFGVAPVASVFGSPYNQMGLITQVCFFVCFLGLIVAVGADEKRFERAVWAMAVTGAAMAVYACMQFFGFDPYLPQSFYTMSSTDGSVVRVIGTAGHSNSLGNFLLYTTPISAALAIATKGEGRWLMAGATTLSAAAIVFSGTRGAWLGLVAGVIAFAALMLGSRLGYLLKRPRRFALQAAIVAVAILIAVWAVGSNPASRGIITRARATATEGFTGAGRTILWRDSIRMIPGVALIGTGPEGFRKAFLAFKSKELARHAPQTNNESSHNAYLDAAISYGLPGMIAYVAIIASSFALLIRARRRAQSGKLRAILAGILSALAAVAIHNFFIYDQLSTALYFFAVVALASVSTRVAGGEEVKDETVKEKAVSQGASRGLRLAIICAGFLLVAATAWYAIALLRADAAIANAFDSASRGEYDRVVREGGRAASAPDPAGDYDLLFASALARCADRMQPGDQLKEERARVIDLGIVHGERSVRHTLTPDSSHLLVAYLALSAKDSTRLRDNAIEAIKWDPNYPSAHWLRAEAYLAEGDREQAMREAELALDIHPSSREARALLKRLRRGFKSTLPSAEERAERGRALAARGRVDKARKVLRRAIKQAKGACPECHRVLASIYEQEKLYKSAIGEWQTFIGQTPDPAAADRARRQVEALKQRAAQE